jgi:type IV secretory pathway VirB2 component (pilin)
LLRVVAGIAIIAAGLVWIQGTAGWVVAAIGLTPMAAGVFDLCLLAPLMGLPFFGRQLRQTLGKR